MPIARAVLPFLLLVGVAACGGDDGGDEASASGREASTTESSETTDTTDDEGVDRDAYVDAATEAVLLSLDEETPELSEGDAGCLAAAVVDGLGADALADAGVTPEELAASDSLAELGVEVDDTTRDSISSGVTACGIDFGASIATEMAAQVGADALSQESVDCIAAGVASSGRLGDAFVASVLDGDDAAAEIAGEAAAIDGFAACPGSLVELLVAGMESEGAAVPEEGRACLVDQVTPRAAELAQAFLAVGRGDSTGQALIVDVFTACQAVLGLPPG